MLRDYVASWFSATRSLIELPHPSRRLSRLLNRPLHLEASGAPAGEGRLGGECEVGVDSVLLHASGHEDLTEDTAAGVALEA